MLKVFDLLGREIATVVNDVIPAGIHRVQWDAGNLPSGIYFYRIQAGDLSAVRKMVLIR